MPEQVFIADATPAEDAAAQSEAERLAAEIAALQEVEWNAWLSEQSANVQALAAEWQMLRGSRFQFSERIDKQFRRVFCCSSEHGYHESLQSHEHALFLLVHSHRLRAEDKPETHARIRGWGGSYGDPKFARETAQRIAKQITEKHGRLPVAEHDAFVLAELTATEQRAATEAQRQREEAANPRPQTLPGGTT